MRLQNVLIGIVNIMLEIKANTWSCLEFKKKQQNYAIQRNALNRSSSGEVAVLFNITRRFLQCKVRFVGRFSLNSSPEKNDMKIGIHIDQCGSCNTRQHCFEAVWFLNRATERVSPVHIGSKQNLCLCCEPSSPPPFHTVLWMKFFAQLRVWNLDPSFHVFWLQFLFWLMSSKRASDVFKDFCDSCMPLGWMIKKSPIIVVKCSKYRLVFRFNIR